MVKVEGTVMQPRAGKVVLNGGWNSGLLEAFSQQNVLTEWMFVRRLALERGRDFCGKEKQRTEVE